MVQDNNNEHLTPLAIARKAAGLSQSELAEKSGMSVHTIKSCEQGRRNINTAPAIDVVSVAEVLNVPVRSILNEEDPVPKADPTALEVARRSAGISRKQLAEKTGIPFRTIEAYEQRKNDIMQAAAGTVQLLASALGVPIEKIMDN